MAVDRKREEERRIREEEETRRLDEERYVKRFFMEDLTTIINFFSHADELAKSETERAKLERRRLREEKRRIMQLELKRKKAAEAIERRIRTEEHKLLLAQRKLESVRLLTELFRRCQVS